MVEQNERDSQVLALSEPRLRFHPEYETHVVMMFLSLHKKDANKNAASVNQPKNQTNTDGKDREDGEDHFFIPLPLGTRNT